MLFNHHFCLNHFRTKKKGTPPSISNFTYFKMHLRYFFSSEARLPFGLLQEDKSLSLLKLDVMLITLNVNVQLVVTQKWLGYLKYPCTEHNRVMSRLTQRRAWFLSLIKDLYCGGTCFFVLILCYNLLGLGLVRAIETSGSCSFRKITC